MEDSVVRLPIPCLVVLVGPSGSGKSTWAEEQFPADQIVSSDRLRALVGTSEFDQRASKAAFQVLDLVVQERLRRKLTTVVDTTGLDDEFRLGLLEAARRRGIACHAVGFDTPPTECRARNKLQARPVPSKVLTAQIKRWESVKHQLADEGFDGVHSPGPVLAVPSDQLTAPALAAAQRKEPVPMRFGLQLPSFTWADSPQATGATLRRIAHTAEGAGFDSLWVMDHFIQIPQVGREWEDMPEAYTTLGYLAGVTEQIRLGTLVTGIMYRNPALLGKMIATLDVLSGGRMICGLGIGWFEREHTAYGFDYPPVKERYARLEDTLQMLPLLWGKGAPSFEGTTFDVPEAMSYPRPLQDEIPILIGGSGEKKTLRMVARYADACNIFGDPETLTHKLGVLRQHCEDVGRDPSEIEVTTLSTVLVAEDRDALEERIEALKPDSMTRDEFVRTVNAGTVEDHIGRFRAFADAGADCAIVNTPDVTHGPSLQAMGEVIEAFA